MHLVIQSTYEAVELALYKDNTLSTLITISKMVASAQLMPAIAQLLEEHQTTINELSFIAVNQGPGPFTTLRVVLATVNGLSFASKVPLIGIDGLHAMLNEHRNPKYPTTVALFNAFTQEAYFGIDNLQTQTTGWKNCTQLLQELKNTYTQPIRFIGSGAQLFEKEIKEIIGAQAVVPQSLPLAPSLSTISTMATQQFKVGESKEHLMPLYLKQPMLQNRTIKFV